MLIRLIWLSNLIDMEEQFILRVPPSVAERIERLLNEDASSSEDKSLDLSFSGEIHYAEHILSVECQSRILFCQALAFYYIYETLFSGSALQSTILPCYVVCSLFLLGAYASCLVSVFEYIEY